MFGRFSQSQPTCSPVPVWAWVLVRLHQECDAILKNRKRLSQNGKKILTWGWSGNQGSIFQKSKARSELAKADGIEKSAESLSIPPLPTAGRGASCSKLALMVLIKGEKVLTPEVLLP